jgi:hypothetical protein
MNKVQYSCIFLTVEEARGHQLSNGGTLHIITNYEHVDELVDTCELQDCVTHPDLNVRKYRPSYMCSNPHTTET